MRNKRTRTINEELRELAVDLQEVYRWEQERKSTLNFENNFNFVPIEPYCPSESIVKQNEKWAKNQRFAKNYSYGEY